jgi:hypothetical protein
VHNFTLLLQLIGHASRQIDRDGKAQTRPWARTHKGINPDHFSFAVNQRAAGIPWIDRRIGLNQVEAFVRKTKTVDIAVKDC